MILIVFRHLIDLLHGINESFELLFAHLALLDKGSFCVTCDGSIPLNYALIKVVDKLPVPLTDLIVPIVVVEGQ